MFRKLVCLRQIPPVFVPGTLVYTPGIDALGYDFLQDAKRAIVALDTFAADNDPDGYHDFGAVEINSTKLWFKIDGVDAPSHNGIAMCQTGFVGSQ